MDYSSENRNITSPLRVSRDNPRYFTDDSGKAIYLTGSHTWNNLQELGPTDPPTIFDYNAYLDFMIAKNHNFMRMWTWEDASQMNGGWYVVPNVFVRTGPGNALDGKPKFNLNQFNQAYFDRLRARVIAARDRGIYVSIMLFEGWSVEKKESGRDPWFGHPFNINNNVNGINGDANGNGEGEETHTLSIAAVTNIQKSYVRKVIDTVNDLDNVLYEISNESIGSSKDWQYALINYIKSYEAGKPKQHPVGMTYQHPGGSNSNLFNSPADWISPAGFIAGTPDDYGDNPPAATGAKVIITDTDHIGRPVTNPIEAWIWKSFLRGLNPILMDWYDRGISPWYSVVEQEIMRLNMGYTLTYANKMNLAAMTPSFNSSDCSTTYCLRDPGKEYLVYQPQSDFMSNVFPPDITIDLEAGDYTYEWFNPDSGSVTPGEEFSSKRGQRNFRQPFRGDAVLYVYRP